MKQIDKIIERITPLMDELSEVCKEWKFELWNGYFEVRFEKKASEME
jgi:hypothetical protein